MNTVTVSASKSYDILIGSGLLSILGAQIKKLGKAASVCIVSDTNVWPLYGETCRKNLDDAGLNAISFVFPAGEASKNGTVWMELLNFLAENYISRSDCIVALGGGVVGDLAGFAAATYLRGIPYIQVPTTLLAMVDSSVGGKTGIDLPLGKNLCGAFHQPSAVICDLDVLTTLPNELFRDGCAEIIKYALLFDPELFAVLEQKGLDFDREYVIARCVEHKRNVIAEDEFDRGQRMLLNLGHTIGHAIEKCSSYAISHGKAVAIGIAILCRAVKCVDTGRILTLLEQFGLPVTTKIPASDLWEVALSDKKRSSDQVNLIIPHAIGYCRIVPTAVDDVKTLLEEGM